MAEEIAWGYEVGRIAGYLIIPGIIGMVGYLIYKRRKEAKLKTQI